MEKIGFFSRILYVIEYLFITLMAMDFRIRAIGMKLEQLNAVLRSSIVIPRVVRTASYPKVGVRVHVIKKKCFTNVFYRGSTIMTGIRD